MCYLRKFCYYQMILFSIGVLLLLQLCHGQGNQGSDRSAPAIDLPVGPVPGVGERCNTTEICLPYSKRIQYDLTWLCCEDGNGWTAAHILNPLAVYMFFGNYISAWFIAFIFEAFELFVLTFLGGFIIFETNQLELETSGGAILGDALIQGGIGVFVAYLLVRVTNFQPMFSNWQHMPPLLRLKYVLLWFAFSGSFIALRSFVEGFNSGFAIALSIQTALLAGVYPWLTSSEADKRYVWFEDKSLQTRNRTFSLWLFINLFIGLQSIGLQYLPNDWFQTWLASVTVILGLLLLAQRWPVPVVRLLRQRRVNATSSEIFR